MMAYEDYPISHLVKGGSQAPSSLSSEPATPIRLYSATPSCISSPTYKSQSGLQHSTTPQASQASSPAVHNPIPLQLDQATCFSTPTPASNLYSTFQCSTSLLGDPPSLQLLDEMSRSSEDYQDAIISDHEARHCAMSSMVPQHTNPREDTLSAQSQNETPASCGMKDENYAPTDSDEQSLSSITMMRRSREAYKHAHYAIQKTLKRKFQADMKWYSLATMVDATSAEQMAYASEVCRSVDCAFQTVLLRKRKADEEYQLLLSPTLVEIGVIMFSTDGEMEGESKSELSSEMDFEFSEIEI